MQQDSVYAFTGCGREGEPAAWQHFSSQDLSAQAVSFIKFPEYVKFTLALLMHKYSAIATLVSIA